MVSDFAEVGKKQHNRGTANAMPLFLIFPVPYPRLVRLYDSLYRFGEVIIIC